MFVTFRCVQCDQTSRAPIEGQPVVCRHCGATASRTGEVPADGRLERCLVCPSQELFVRKDFPQGLGLAIIGTGFVLSSIALAWHQSILSLAILIASAAVDGLLYLWMGTVLTCYRCHAEYRDVTNMDRHPTFRLEVHERYRQQAARLAEGEREAARSTPAP